MSVALLPKNNFINNSVHATFVTNPFRPIGIPHLYIDGGKKIEDDNLRNRWNNNYWDDWNGDGPKLIQGKIGYMPSISPGQIVPPQSSFIGLLPFYNFDWNPAKEPYDITIPEAL